MQLIRNLYIRANIGIALSVVGVPLGMYFNYFFPQIRWAPVFMVLSILFVIDIRKISDIRNWRMPQIGRILLFFQLLMIIYGWISENLTAQYMSFHLFIIIMIIAFSSLKKFTLGRSTILYISLISSFCSLLGAVTLYNGLVVGDDAWQLRQDNEDYALESFTVAWGCLINFASTIFFLSNKKIKQSLIALFFIFLDLYVILYTSKRTPLVVLILMLVIFLYNKKAVRFNEIFKALLISISVGMLLYLNFSQVELKVDTFIKDFYYGVLNILGDQSISDSSGSGIARYNFRVWTYDYIHNNFAFFNYIFGAGYMTMWIDNPVLQSYLDMGILGIFLYILIVLLYPLSKLKSGKMGGDMGLFCTMLCIHGIVSAFSSGNPYIYVKYLPVVLLMYSICNNKFAKHKNIKLRS